MKIGIYGGTFNPVHFGHVNLARRAIADLALDRLIVVPANVSPFKTGSFAESPLWDRVGRVQAAFAGVEKAEVSLAEIERGGVSYAIDTVRGIAARFAAESPKLYFVVGEDSLAGLEHWKDYSELVKLVEFVSYPRTEESSTAIRRLFDENHVELNGDARLAAAVEEGVKRKNGFCPCRLPKSPEFFCPCREFREQLADPGFHGLCHCRLYQKP